MSSPYRTFKCRLCGMKKNNPSNEDISICQDCNDEMKEKQKAEAESKFDIEKIREIKAKKLTDRTTEEEFLLAEYEKRCPICVFCEKPLKTIKEIQDVDLFWDWDEKTKRYVKGEGDGCSNKPYCANCETKDWEFTNNNLASY